MKNQIEDGSKMKEILEFHEIEPEYDSEERAFQSDNESYVISQDDQGDWFLQEKLAEEFYENVAKGSDLQELKTNAKNQRNIIIRLDIGRLNEGEE